MSIEIRITDPHLLDQTILRKTAVFLLEISGNQCEVQEDRTPSRSLSPIPPPPPLAPSALGQTIGTVGSLENTHSYEALLPHEHTNPAVSGSPIPNAAYPGLNAAIREGLDSQGMPWDARIHSRTKTKSKTGEWKLKREVSPEMVTLVKTELQTTMAIPHAVSSIPEQTQIPMPPSTQGIPPAPTVENPFPRVMKKITGLSNLKKINPAQVLAIVQSVGLPSLPVVASRPDLIPQVEYIIDRIEEGYGVEESISFMKTVFAVNNI